MLLLGFIFFLVFLTKLGSPTTACYTYFTSNIPTNIGCSGPRTYSGSSINLQTTKELSVSITLMPTNLCSMPQDFNFFTVSIFPASRSAAKTMVMMVTYYRSTGAIVFRSEDSNGIQASSLNFLPLASFLNKPMNLFVTANLATGSFKFQGGGTLGDRINAWPATVTYGSDWVFDASTQIDVCSDGSTNYIACFIQNLKVTSSYFDLPGILDLGNSITIIADYKMKDGSGISPTTSQGTLGDTVDQTFFPTGWTLPDWDQETGLQFKSSAHLIQLPGFIPSAPDMTILTSLGLSFIFTIDAAPAANSYIFNYLCVNPLVLDVIWSLQVTPGMKLRALVETTFTEGTIILNPGEWYWIYASFIYTAGKIGVSNIYVNGALDVASYVRNAQGVSKLSTSDVIRFGSGFVGKLRRVQVLSPAALKRNPNPCQPSTCKFDIGFDNPPICLIPVCNTPGKYASLETCESCPARCATCTDPTTCHSCAIGYYLDGTTCKKCPMHCSSCTDSTTCQSCQPGYGLHNNNLCVLCPVGTYLDSSSSHICKKLSSALQNTLRNSQLVNSAATQVANILSKGSSVSLSAMVGGKIFSQIKYLNISYSGELQVALLTWLSSFVSLGLTPDLPNSIVEKIPERDVPYVFEKYDIVSSFLLNFWENFGIVVFVTLFWVLFKGLELVSNSKKALVSRKLRVFAQNFLFGVLFGVYGDLIMFALIEYRSLIFGWNLSLLSFLLSVILIIIMFLTFWSQTRLLLNYQRIKKQDRQNLEKFKTAHEGSQVLFKDLKDYSISPQLFLFFISGRDVIFSLMLATMFDDPLVQIIIIILLDLLMLAYLFIKRPFQSAFDFWQQLFFEFIGLTVNIAVLVNAILDTGKYETIQARYNIGKLVIVANLIFNFVAAVLMLIVIAQNLLQFYREQKQKREKKLGDLALQSRLQKPLPSLYESTQKNERITSEQSLFQTHNNSIETISFQQESFDLNLLPSQIQSTTHPRRCLKNNTQRRLHAPANEMQIPSYNLNYESQRRKDPSQNPNRVPTGSLVSSIPKHKISDRTSLHERAHQERIKSRSRKLYN